MTGRKGRSGRPRGPRGRDSARLNVRMSAELRDAIAREAVRRGTTPGQLAHDLIADALTTARPLA